MILKNALAALPGEPDFKRVDLAIKNGKIEKIADPGSLNGAEQSSSGTEMLDVRGLLLFPGAIDPMRESRPRILAASIVIVSRAPR